MCGRYGFGNPARLSSLPFGVALPLLEERYNVTPSGLVPLVRQRSGGRDALLARWGLVPYWAADPSIGHKLANARGDTMASKPSFKEAFQRRRGLMPADLFYEWQNLEGQKQRLPWCIRLADDAPFAFGALWERWRPRDQPDADPLVTCAIITTEPNAVLAPIHDRMPLIIEPGDYDEWMDPGTLPARAQALVRPSAQPMEAWRVSTRVNSPRFDDPACIEPLA